MSNIGAVKQSGSLAQLVEQRTFNPLVAGSNPARPTRISNKIRWLQKRQVKALKIKPSLSRTRPAGAAAERHKIAPHTCLIDGLTGLN